METEAALLPCQKPIQMLVPLRIETELLIYFFITRKFGEIDHVFSNVIMET